ncbi:MAG: LamG-like jellyroll fold domain-containing protein [Candidatus Falkowbacteria bacterium]
MRTRKSSAFGFTLIEILVVTIIIAVLLTLVIAGIRFARIQARDSKRMTDVKQVQAALELYFNRNNSYPSMLVAGQLFGDGSGDDVMVPYNPKPSNDGICASGAEYIYITSSVGYLLGYCLGMNSGVVSAGNHYVTPVNQAVESGNDSYTKLLVHMHGASGNTTFIDSSSVGNVLTNYNSVAYSSAQSLYNGTSGKFNGTNQYLRLPYSSNFNLSSGDWTIDAWFNSNSFASSQAIISKDKNGLNYDWSLLLLNTTTIALYTAGTSQNLTVTVPAMVPGQWYHLAYIRSGTSDYIYLNGVSYGSKVMSITNNSQDYITIGCNGWNNPNTFFNGYIDELRVSKGIARWTANFTPPSLPY